MSDGPRGRTLVAVSITGEPVRSAKPDREVQSVRSLDRAFELLELLAANGGESSLSELTESSGLPLPTTHRVVRAMMRKGYVRQLQSKRYTLGPRLIGLGEVATRKLGACADPHLQDLVDELGETVNMAMLDGSHASLIAQAAAPRAMRLALEVGSRAPLHCTALGKAILASLPRSQVHSILDRVGLERMTDRTVVELAALDEVLAEVRDRGFAVDDGELEVGLRCIAVPVLDSPAPMAISISAPSPRLPDEATKELVARLESTAQQLLVCT